MSIANIVCQGSRGYLLADRGYFHPDGRLAFTARKALELPKLNAAIVARGHLKARDEIAAGIRAARPCDVADLFSALPTILHDALRDQGAFASPEMASTLATQLSVVYIHPDTRRAAGAIIASDGTGLPDWYVPFSFIPVTEATQPGVDVAAAIGRDADLSDAHQFDIKRDGVRVMEAQRASVWTFNGLPSGHHAAGGVDLTTVTAGSVTTRELCRWPDRVGERIKPNCA